MLGRQLVNAVRTVYNHNPAKYIHTTRWWCDKFRIYTRTGDKGKTSTYTNERRHKDDQLFEALGDIDELSSHIGYSRELASKHGHVYCDELFEIQCTLQDIASAVATPPSSARELHLFRAALKPGLHTQIEKWIDHHDTTLPPLLNFILPGGGEVSARLHITRTVCRRAERRIVSLYRNKEASDDVVIYINRLSDYLFTIARLAAQLDGNEDTIYVKS